MTFSIITPSFRSSQWLQLCIASVADQEVEHEHIVQDACSDDGTQEWLPKDPRVKAFIEKDHGMYDGVNRGLRRAKGDLVAYLNSDEQYLPGALARVQEFFQRHPDIEIVFADAIVVDPEGNYICHRPVYPPSYYHTRVANLSTLTCAMFFRRSLLDAHEMFFDPEYKIAGDSEWVLRLCQKRVRMKALRCLTSVFTDTGDNLALNPKLEKEKERFLEGTPGWVRAATPWFVWQHRVRRFLAGLDYRKPFSYSLYTQQSPGSRVTKQALHPTIQWRRVQPAQARGKQG